MKQLAWYTAVSLATLSVVFLLWEIRTAVILFILSLTVAAMLRPMVDFLAFHRLPRGVALGFTYLIVMAGFAALVWTLGGSVMTEFRALATDLPGGYEQIRTQWLSGSWQQQTIAKSLPGLNDVFQMVIGGQWKTLAQNFLGMTLGSFDLISKMTIVFVVSMYWSADQEHFKRLWLSLLPSELRMRWREAWQAIENEIGAYLRSELIQSLLTVILLAAGYQLIGLKYPVLSALCGAIGWLVVWYGGLIAAVPALLAGLAISPATGLWAVILTFAAISLLEFVVQPRLYNRQRLSSLLVILIVLILVKQYGITGFLAAPPLAAAVQIIASQVIRPSAAATAIPLEPPPAVQIEGLKERLQAVQQMVTVRAEPPSPEIVNLIERLDALIDEADREDHLNQ